MPLFNPGIDSSGGTISGSLTVGTDLTVDNDIHVGGNGDVTGTFRVTGASTLGVVNSSGNTTVTAGDLVLATAGKGLRVKEGSNARMGTGTLNGITEVTVATTAVTASSRIFITIESPGGTIGGMGYVSSRVAGTSFGVKGLVVGDTSTFAWLIVEPSP